MARRCLQSAFPSASSASAASCWSRVIRFPAPKQKIVLLYNNDVDFPAVLAKAAQLRDTYNVTVLPQAKKLGKQLGQLEACRFRRCRLYGQG